MRFRQLAVPFLASLVLLGCGSQDRDPAPQTASAPESGSRPAAKDEQAWRADRLPAEGAKLEVFPNPALFCVSQRVPVEVRWDMSGANPRTLQLWLEGPAGDRKLWVAPSVRQGTKTTGAWMQEGSRVVAVDASTNVVLAIVPITAHACEA